MKKLTIIFLMLAASVSFAQNAPIDFEPGGHGADWTWTVFENDTNPPLEIIANPDQSGINTSGTVAKFTALQSGQPVAGCESQHGADLGAFVLDETNNLIKIMVWKPVISDVGIKLVSSTNWSQGEIKVANTLTNQWEELTFDFTGFINPPDGNGVLDQIVIFPDFDLSGRTQDNIIYFDNMTFNPSNGGGNPNVPEVAAPTPPQRNPEDVFSLFSGAYSNVPVDTWLTEWSSALLQDLTIEGNPTKRYFNLDFAGIETVENQLDLSEMLFLHMDVWSPNFTMFGIKLVDFGPDGAYGGGDDSEHQIDFFDLPTHEWVSLDIPLSDFTGLNALNNMAQYILVGQPTGSADIYFDNFYFYKGEPLSASNIGQNDNRIQVYPNPVKLGGQVQLGSEVNQFELLDLSGRVLISANTLVVETDKLSRGIYVLRIHTRKGEIEIQKLVVN
jgi:hypothetical protein